MSGLKLGLINKLTLCILFCLMKYGYSVTEMIIIKEVDLTKAKPFQILTFSFFYSNSGDNYATNVNIIDYLPEHTQYITNSGENNNQLHAGTVAVEYWAANAWRSSNYDNTNGNVTNILKVKWRLNSNVQAGEFGTINFKVLIK